MWKRSPSKDAFTEWLFIPSRINIDATQCSRIQWKLIQWIEYNGIQNARYNITIQRKLGANCFQCVVVPNPSSDLSFQRWTQRTTGDGTHNQRLQACGTNHKYFVQFLLTFWHKLALQFGHIRYILLFEHISGKNCLSFQRLAKTWHLNNKIQERKETLLKPIQGEGRPKIQCAQMARAQRVKEKRFEDGLTKLPGDCNTVNQEKREKIR